MKITGEPSNNPKSKFQEISSKHMDSRTERKKVRKTENELKS